MAAAKGTACQFPKRKKVERERENFDRRCKARMPDTAVGREETISIQGSRLAIIAFSKEFKALLGQCTATIPFLSFTETEWENGPWG